MSFGSFIFDLINAKNIKNGGRGKMHFVEKSKELMNRFMQEEDGFQVFEKFGLTQGGVILALGVAAVAVIVMNTFWSEVGHHYYGANGIDGLDPTTAPGYGWGTGSEINTGW